MTLTDMYRNSAHAGHHTAGWMISVLLHGSLVVGAFFFVHRIQLAPQSEPFKWNVALVSPDSQPIPSSTSSPFAPSPPSAPVKPTTPSVTARMQPVLPIVPPVQPQSVQATTSVVTPPPLSTPPPQADAQLIQPIPQTMAPTPTAAAKPMDPVPAVPEPTPITPPSPVESIKQTTSHVESVSPSHPAAPNNEAAPVPTQRELDSSVVVVPSHPEPPQPIPPVASTSPEPSPAVTPRVTAPPVETPVHAASTAPQVAALAPPMSNRPARADYGWLSEAILRRVEELKRYPAEARVDRAEGKVVVKAVINEDGSVDDVEIFQSSGYTTLDKAAADLMRRAAPFHLPHPLGKPRVTIKIPMSYRLDR